MKYSSEFRSKKAVNALREIIHTYNAPPVKFMEVCGGHTMAIQKFGIPRMLPGQVKLISGPGCPVCVTSREYLDQAIWLGQQENIVIATYGDLIRVPGSYTSLDQEKGKGAKVHIVYSAMEALQLARQNPGKKIVFLGIGFETTAPASAVTIQAAREEEINNFFILSAHKIMPPAMEALVKEEIDIQGFIAPGHVSTITGPAIYQKLAAIYNIPVVISGFEPVDILQSIRMLLDQVKQNQPRVEIQYKRAVKKDGNPKARAILQEVFETADDWWRGLGVLPSSGLQLRKEYRAHDARQLLPGKMEIAKEPAGCICGEVLKGLKQPDECKLFRKVCHPANPVGACMVSNEGACAAYFKYGNN